jgi:hypothetical protein
MAASLDMKAAVPSHVLIQELEGESVLLNLNKERYFGLDEVGTQMWKALTTCESIGSAYQRLLSEYDVDAEVLRRDMDGLVEKLLKQGLLECATTDGEQVA